MKSFLLLAAVASANPFFTFHANLFVMALSTSTFRTVRKTVTFSLPPLMSESNLLDTLEDAQQTGTASLSPFLQDMVDEQRELQMNVGKAMDVLRSDYPYFLKRVPDYSIYHDSITLRDSTGAVQLSKLSSYKKTVSVMRTMLSLIYDTDRSVIQNRMVYDPTRTQIRISFNAMLVPKLGGRTVHVDGISVYSIDSLIIDGKGRRREGGGKVVEHKIEKLLVNGAPLKPPYFSAFGFEQQVANVGALAGAGAWS